MGKIVIFISAELCAGKTTLAKKIAEEANGEYYSIREIIEKEMDRFLVSKKDREQFTFFSEKRKKLNGPEFFIKKGLDEFKKTTSELAVIESLRCPGEIDWSRLKEKSYDMKFLFVGITAPQKQRFKRFLKRDQKENLNEEKNWANFLVQEKLANHGEKPWEENVSETILKTDFIINNRDGAFEKNLEFVIQALSLMREPKAIY